MTAARDAYGFPVTSSRRYRGCRCKVPCQRAYECRSVYHRSTGSRGRLVAWCFGAADSKPHVCDDCAAGRKP